MSLISRILQDGTLQVGRPRVEKRAFDSRLAAPVPAPAKPPPAPRVSSDELLRRLDERLEKFERSVEGAQRANDARAVEDLERQAESLRRREPSLSKAHAFAKACEENPELYAGHVRQMAARSPATTVAIVNGRLAEQEIDRRADELVRKTELSHAQAAARVMAEHPELYAKARAGQLDRSRLAPAERSSPPGTPRDAAWEPIEKAASALQAAEPKLSPAQAVAKALKQQPELYAEYQAGPR